MQLQFFPSRTLAFYMARSFFVRTIAILAALVIILQTLDLLGESGDILAAPGNGEAALWHYIGLRLPQIVMRFLPFSVLLSTLLTLATLNQNSEIISMKAAGVSAHQILAPLILTSILFAGFSFAFNERIVTHATAALDAWQNVDYGTPPKAGTGVTNIWVRDGDDLIHADIVTGSRAATRLAGVTIYDRDGGALKRIIDAPFATAQIIGGKVSGWQLHTARLFDVGAGQSRLFAANPVFGRNITPEQFTLASVDADERSFLNLRTAIGELSAAGRPTGPLEAGLWHKISGPMSAILMPLLAAVAAFGLARSGQLVMRAVLGMILGFTYFVADNFSLAMGSFGAYPPLLAAWAPFFLFLLIGEAVLIRTEE